MKKARLEAFSDGVIAIIITIMVLELKVPHEHGWSSLSGRGPIFISYVLSFFFVGVYWSNHHHLVHTVRHVDPKILWANLHLLFWMSLIPFTTAWLGESHVAPEPAFLYGAVMFATGVAYAILQTAIARQQTDAGVKSGHRRQGWKAYMSLACYATGLPLAWFGLPWISVLLYLAVAIAWAWPERGFEHAEAE